MVREIRQEIVGDEFGVPLIGRVFAQPVRRLRQCDDQLRNFQVVNQVVQDGREIGENWAIAAILIGVELIKVYNKLITFTIRPHR
jgi:hypothetical protein